MKKLLLLVLVVLSACAPVKEVKIDAACRAEHPYQVGLGDPCRRVGEPKSMQDLVP